MAASHINRLPASAKFESGYDTDRGFDPTLSGGLNSIIPANLEGF